MQILKTVVVDHGSMPVVEFHGQGGEEIQVRLNARSATDDDETLIEVAKVMMLHAAAFDEPIGDGGKPGTSEQKPRWEGPPENRPAGYLPADDDPYRDRDAAGETLTNPDKRSLSDALATRNGAKER